MLNIEIAKKIINKFDSPCYVFDENEFVLNYHNLLDTFRKYYPQYNIAYSYKTNYTPYVCELVKSLGGYAEVVSDMEYDLAIKIGYKPEHIIYNGPCKGPVSFEHIKFNGILNIDNYYEAVNIINYAKNNPQNTFKVGLRLNFDVDANYISRFGIEIYSDEYNKILKDISLVNNIKIVGLHCHISRSRGLDSWKKRIDTLLKIADEIIVGVPEYIDVGSGMYGQMDTFLANQFEGSIPSYEEYAITVAKSMYEHYSRYENKPILFSEPGTTIVSKYFSIITKVVQKKKIRTKNFATVDTSYYNLGGICKMKKLPYYIIRAEKISNNGDSPIDIMGYTCLEQDCLYKDMEDYVNVGDYIVFDNVGGYSIVSKPPFIQPNCKIVAYNNGAFKIIKRDEKLNDIFKTFKFGD